MRVKFIGGGPLNGKVKEIPSESYPQVLVYEPPNYTAYIGDLDKPVSLAPRIDRYFSLQPGINGGPKRLVWQGYDKT